MTVPSGAAAVEQRGARAPVLLPCFGLHPDRFADDRPLPTPAAVDATLPGQRNEPANLAVTRDYIAAAHGVSRDRVEEVTTANARRLFPRLGAAGGAAP